MKKNYLLLIAIVLTNFFLAARVSAQELSIYEIQYTTDPNGNSPLEGRLIDCTGGIVTHKYGGGQPKLTIQDPNFSTGWGAIQVKDWQSGAPLINKAAIGDWVKLTNVFVEEYRGNTTLQCLAEFSPQLTVISRSNSLPEPLVVDVNEIAAPEMDAFGDWYVKDHSAEKYEHARLIVRNIVVTAIGHGKSVDNYILHDSMDVNDPNRCCWAADYMNEDKTVDYHPYVLVGQHFCSVQGILEQYMRISSGWDYYQLVTTNSGDFIISQTADFDNDCDVDFDDFGCFARLWLSEKAFDEEDSCATADLTGDKFIDLNDLAEFSWHWLIGK